jgi:hypothetical protein
MNKPEWERCAISFEDLAERLDRLRVELRESATKEGAADKYNKLGWLEAVAWCAGAAEGSARILRKLHEGES